MASVNSWFVQRNDNRRPCICLTSDGFKKCLFHCWSNESYIVGPSLMVGGHNGGTVSNTVGILEFEDGSIKKVNPNDFRFDDDGGFKDFAWSSECEEK